MNQDHQLHFKEKDTSATTNYAYYRFIWSIFWVIIIIADNDQNQSQNHQSRAMSQPSKGAVGGHDLSDIICPELVKSLLVIIIVEYLREAVIYVLADFVR